MRKKYSGAELVKLRCLYGAITEMDSDFNGREIKYYTKSISTYTGLSVDWIPQGLKIFIELGIIKVEMERINGQYKGKRLVFTPEKMGIIPQETVTGKTVTGKTVNGYSGTSEDIPLLEHSNVKEESIKQIVERVLAYLNQKTGKKFRTTTRGYYDKIKARLKHYTEAELIQVIDNMYSAWFHNTKMKPYLTPVTLFRSDEKVDVYLNQGEKKYIPPEERRND